MKTSHSCPQSLSPTFNFLLPSPALESTVRQRPGGRGLGWWCVGWGGEGRQRRGAGGAVSGHSGHGEGAAESPRTYSSLSTVRRLMTWGARGGEQKEGSRGVTQDGQGEGPGI